HHSLAELVRAAGLVGQATSAGVTTAEARALDDAALMATQRTLAEVRRQVEACAAVLAGETVRRSSADAGLEGLARREGFRTPEALVRGLTGATSREAATLVYVGGMLNDAEASVAADGGADVSNAVEPWLVAVGASVTAGSVSVAAAEAIRSGLGRPGPGVSVDVLGAAALELIESITTLSAVDADQVLRLARNAR